MRWGSVFGVFYICYIPVPESEVVCASDAKVSSSREEASISIEEKSVPGVVYELDCFVDVVDKTVVSGLGVLRSTPICSSAYVRWKVVVDSAGDWDKGGVVSEV